MVKHRPMDTFTVHVKQQSDGGVRIEIDGRRSGTCMFALMMYAFINFMEGSDSTFEDVVGLIKEQLEGMEESKGHAPFQQ